VPSGAGASVYIAPDGGTISFLNLQGFINGLGLGTSIANTVRTFVEVAIGNLNLSVGVGYISVETAAEILSEVVADIAAAAEANLPPPIDLRDTPPVQDQLPTPGTLPMHPQVNGVWYPDNWFDYWAMIDQGLQVATPGTPIPGGGGTANGGDDVGWFEDTYEWVDENIFSGNLPGGAPPNGGGGGSGFAPPPTTIPPPGGQPPFNLPPSGGMAACGPGGGRPTYKYYCGQYRWVYPKRRRRKRLASKGDLADLAALKGILGGGKAFEVWIATHS